MAHRIMFILGLVSAVFLYGQIVIEPVNREVTVSGIIREVHGYGAPGYGEDKKTDARITYLVIDLPSPINISCTPEKPEWAPIDCDSAKKLKLFFTSNTSGDELERIAKQSIGKGAHVRGYLQRQETVGEMTPIYINVTNIQILP